MSRRIGSGGGLPVIACSLDARAQRARFGEWAEVLEQATAREETRGGLRYAFPASRALEKRVRELADAEQACCSFLDFAVTGDGEQVTMTVSAPREAREALRLIFRP